LTCGRDSDRIARQWTKGL